MNRLSQNIVTGAFLIIFSAVLKVITFPHSINPIIAISLFSGVVIKDKKMAFVLPLFAMFASDLLLEATGIADGFYGTGQIGNYLSLLFVTFIGFGMKRISSLNVVAFSLISSISFYLLSNTNVFLFDSFPSTYSKDFNGWINCLVAGIPFIKNSLVNDLCFSAILFGGYSFIVNRQIKTATQKI
jgi:hypothetical protein